MCTTQKENLAFGPPVGLARGYWMDDRGSIPGRGKNFSSIQSAQTGYGSQPASYPMVIRGKEAGGRSWTLTSI
jgi:hypothetical protein